MFLTPKWDAIQGYYSIEVTDTDISVLITRNHMGSTVFPDLDGLHNSTDEILHALIREGEANNWFSKLPSHEQLMKRVKHTFAKLATGSDNRAILSVIQMTPKQLTLVWSPITVLPPPPPPPPPPSPPSPPYHPHMEEPHVVRAPPLYFEDSDSDAGTEPELQESALPPVALRDSVQESHEDYLLARLRAAKARVETEQIRMEYFETTGRMPPDSDDEDEDE